MYKAVTENLVSDEMLELLSECGTLFAPVLDREEMLQFLQTLDGQNNRLNFAELQIATLRSNVTDLDSRVDENVRTLLAHAQTLMEHAGHLTAMASTLSQHDNQFLQVHNDIDKNSEAIEDNMAKIEANATAIAEEASARLLLSLQVNNTAQQVVNQSSVLNTLRDDVNAVRTVAYEASSIAKGANQAMSYDDYPAAINALLARSNVDYDPNPLKIGQNIYILQPFVPDLWIAHVFETEYYEYEYVSDEDVIESLTSIGFILVGKYALGQLESQQARLTNIPTYDNFKGGLKQSDNNIVIDPVSLPTVALAKEDYRKEWVKALGSSFAAYGREWTAERKRGAPMLMGTINALDWVNKPIDGGFGFTADDVLFHVAITGTTVSGEDAYTGYYLAEFGGTAFLYLGIEYSDEYLDDVWFSRTPCVGDYFLSKNGVLGQVIERDYLNTRVRCNEIINLAASSSGGSNTPSIIDNGNAATPHLDIRFNLEGETRKAFFKDSLLLGDFHYGSGFIQNAEANRLLFPLISQDETIATESLVAAVIDYTNTSWGYYTEAASVQHKIKPRGLYMVFSTGTENLKLCKSDGTVVVSGASQIIIMTAPYNGNEGDVSAFVAMGMQIGKASLTNLVPVTSVQVELDKGSYITGDTIYYVSEMVKGG